MPTRTQASREARRDAIRDWLDALHDHVDRHGRDATARLLEQLDEVALTRGVRRDTAGRTPHELPCNTIPRADEPEYPGDLALERRIEALVRWNAIAMVARANAASPGIGGHISTYASAATLYEVAFHHFLRGRDGSQQPHDRVYYQGHAAPGIYARAFVEGRLSEQQLDGFRRELSKNGLPSYPHPRALPDFWELPTVSMGLAPLMGVYQARFDRYLVRRGLASHTGRSWVFCGDGEMDEPESTAGLAVAAREGLGNLIFVVNCNLQRLDGPVRPSARIADELAARFHGAGWRVIDVRWGSEWDPLFAADRDGLLLDALSRTVDGDWQRWAIVDGATFRDELFGSDPRLLELVAEQDDAAMRTFALARGGHDPRKVHAAYAAAVAEEDLPTVVLANTIKGFGLGEWGEGRNATHKRQTLPEDALRALRDRFEVPIDDAGLRDVCYVRPPPDSAEARYLAQRRAALGGAVPKRVVVPIDVMRRDVPKAPFAEAHEGSGEREVSTTAVVVRLLTALLQDESIGELLVPIVPDEARTFGMEPLFRSVGIHAARAPRYEPVDAGTLTEYRETTEGQLLEEGITEAGAMASAIAAGTAHVTHGLPMVPFYFFYSMFGFQRIGDLIWAAGDALARGFLIGATSGRTTLNGEGLQHEDGHSHLLAMSNPAVRAYDTAFAFEIAFLVEDGLRRMFEHGAQELVYLTVANAAYRHPPMPDGARTGVLRGLYRLHAPGGEGRPCVRLLASGPLVPEALAAREVLEEDHGVRVDFCVVTSWSALYLDALAAERDLRLGRGERSPWVTEVLGTSNAPIVAVSDFVQHLPHVLAHWLPGRLWALGTHGFGRSDTRNALRSHFEIDRDHVVHAALFALGERGEVEPAAVERAAAALHGAAERAAPYPVPESEDFES